MEMCGNIYHSQHHAALARQVSQVEDVCLDPVTKLCDCIDAVDDGGGA